MRALFLKEFNQGRPLLVFALVLALLLPIGCAVVSRALFRLDPGFEPLNLQLIAGFAALLAPLFIALLASSGIFSSEVAAGTTPILFALPLSRRRIWAAMLLAALALTAAGAIVILGVNRLLLPSAFRLISIRAYLPDLICLTLFFVSVGIFCSSLTRSVTAALAVSVLLAGALTGGASALVTYFGAPLLGLPTLDVALWCLLASPALILSSLLPITRGELLTAPRKWHALAVFTATIGVAITFLLACGLVRLATRYDRSRVTSVSGASLEDGGRVISILSHGRDVPVPMSRLEVAAHLGLLNTDTGPPGGTPDTIPVPTANYWVALDLDTGKELFTARVPTAYPSYRIGPPRVALSPDGSRLASIDRAPGLTWGVREGKPQQLRIVDLKENYEIYRGSPDPLQWGSSYTSSWSPSGRYFALTRKGTFHLFNPDGSHPGKRPVSIRLESTTWSPVEDVILGIDRNGALVRAFPDGRKTEIIWAPPPDVEVEDRSFTPTDISPDGRWVVLTDTIAKTAEDERGQTYEQRLSARRLVNTEDGSSRIVWQAPERGITVRALRWLPDGTLIALQAERFDGTPRRYTFHLLRMRPGEDRLSPIAWETEAAYALLYVGSKTDEAFVHAVSWSHSAPLPVTLEGEQLTAVSMDGSTREIDLPPATEIQPYAQRIVGFDHRGRLIVLSASERTGSEHDYPLFERVDALDVTTGALTTIYP